MSYGEARGERDIFFQKLEIFQTYQLRLHKKNCQDIDERRFSEDRLDSDVWITY